MLFLSLIVPTYNESENLPILLNQIHSCLANINKEVIVVDDNSPDHTWEIARSLTALYPWLRVVRRMHERGLSSAVLAGFELAEGEILAVMDSDLQHDENALLPMLKSFENGADIVVASRKAQGGGIHDWSPTRKFISWLATFFAKFVLPRTVSDPMSGFFALKRSLYVQHKASMNPRGFKILLEFLVRAKNNNIQEVGYTFKPRIHGESKLSTKVIVAYLCALYDLSFGKYLPLRFLKYGLIGVSGFCVATAVIFFCEHWISLAQVYTIALSIEVSIITNFFLNNYWTFRTQRLQGVVKILQGILTFHATCLSGAFINQAITTKVMSFGFDIYFSNFFGYFIAAIWNYMINVNITWKGKS